MGPSINQIPDSTWLEAFNRLYPALNNLTDAAKLEYKSNVEYSKGITDQLTKDNQLTLAKAGVAPDPTNTIMARILGPGDTLKVVVANPDALAKDILSKSTVAANPNLIGPTTTIGDLRSQVGALAGNGSPILPSGQTKQENFNADFSQTVKGLKDVAAARADSNKEGFIAQQLSEQEAKAQKDGITLTAQQVTELKAAAGAKFDASHQNDGAKAQQKEAADAEREILGYDQQRKLLLDQINTAQKEGNTSKVAELETSLRKVNDELEAAFPNAKKLADALGDQQMIAKLQKVADNTAKINKEFTVFGLSASQTKGLVHSFADGVVTGFDSFTKAIVDGQNAVQALGNAFLQFASDFLRQIANMTLKQMVLNAVQSFVPGLGLGKLAAGHTGGMVGAAAIGGGNISRSISPAWYGNAMKYHGGGIVGLRPDEVPAVLKRNEEVLTTQDPRHRYMRAAVNLRAPVADRAGRISVRCLSSIRRTSQTPWPRSTARKS